MKKLLACCSFFVSSLALGQAVPQDPSLGNFWIDGKTLTLAYSNLNAPGNVSNTLMMQVLADVEADIDGLNLPGLQVHIDTNVRATGCAAPGQNTVVVCWESISGNTGNYANISGGNGLTFWREGNVMLSTQSSWNSAADIYPILMHQLLHVLGFGHPDGSGTSVLNGAADITQIDIDGLRAMFSANRCTLNYDANRDILIPYVRYRGNAYRATIHHNGGVSFSLAPGTTMYSLTNPPLTPCQNIEVDANNHVHLPRVNVYGTIYWGDLTLANGGLTLTAHGI